VRPEASIVVASHEMARELPRTLRSLSPSYQRNCPRGRIEVIVVDNGSATPPRPEELEGLDLDLQIHRTERASPSPARAMNLGIGMARAPLVCAWIDGARLASRGLIDAAIRAAALHAQPVVHTANYQLGPGPQYQTMQHGYDAAEEDRLLASIGWPQDGERLFEIAVPVDFGGPTGRITESNALFLKRNLWEALGGFDEAFDSPGGGPCNPDVFLRACAAPGAQLIRVLGEATFHQIHGGVATNAGERMAQVLKAIGAEYYRVRGRPLVPVRHAGWTFDARTGELVRG
jgi:hypothetical protein